MPPGQYSTPESTAGTLRFSITPCTAVDVCGADGVRRPRIQWSNAVTSCTFNRDTGTVGSVTVAIAENADGNTAVSVPGAPESVVGVTASSNSGSTLTYALGAPPQSPGNCALRHTPFAVDAATGRLHLVSNAGALAVDHEDCSTYELQLDVTSAAESLVETCFVTVSVSDVNEPPVVLTPSPIELHVHETTAPRTPLGDAVQAEDQDLGQALTFSIAAVHPASQADVVAVGLCSGQLALASRPAQFVGNVLDFETAPAFNVTVTVTDDGDPVLESEVTFAVMVLDDNERPAFTPLTDALTVAEDAAPMDGVGAPLVVSDPDSGPAGTVTFAVPATAAVPFAVNASTGQLRVAGALDFETTSTYVVPVTATDGGSPPQSSSLLVTVDVLDVNEPPTWRDAAPLLTVAESAPPGTPLQPALSQLSTDQDVEAGDVLVWAVEGGTGAALFAVDAATGQVRVSPTSTDPLALDFEANSLAGWTLVVSVTDRAGLAATATVTVMPEDVQEPPYVLPGGAQLSVPENSAPLFQIGRLSEFVADPDAGDALSFQLDAATPAGFLDVFAVHTVTGLLEVSAQPGAALDFEGAPSQLVTLRVLVTDSHGATVVLPVDVALTDVNEPPVIAADQVLTVPETASGNAVVGVVDAADPDDSDALTLSVRPLADPSDAATTGRMLRGLKDGATLFAVTPQREVVLGQFARLDFETTAQYGLRVRVTDASGAADDAVVTVDVADAPEAPAVRLPDGQDVWDVLVPAAPGVGPIGLPVPVVSEAGTVDSLQFSIAAGNGAGAFAVDAATGQLRVADASAAAPLLPAAGTHSLTVQAADTGTALFVQVEVLVTATDDAGNQAAPQFVDPPTSVAVPENADDDTVVLAGLTAADADAGDTVTFVLPAALNPPAVLDLVRLAPATGALTVFVADGAALDHERAGGATFKVVVAAVDAGGLSSSTTMMFTITDVPEAPVVLPVVLVVPESATPGTPLGTVDAFDQDTGDTVAFAVVGDPADAGAVPSAVVSVHGTTGAVHLEQAVDFEQLHAASGDGTATLAFHVAVSDAGGRTTTVLAALHVNNVNEPPVLPSVAVALSELADVGVVVVDLRTAVTDPDSPPLPPVHTFRLETDSATFTLEPDGRLLLAAPLQFEVTPVHQLAVVATDLGVDGSFSDTLRSDPPAVVTVTVRDENNMAVDAVEPATLSTEGSETVTLTGTRLGPVDSAAAGVTIDVAVTYGRTGVEYTATNCTFAAPSTVITCLSVQGAGSGLLWRVSLTFTPTTVDGAAPYTHTFTTPPELATAYRTPDVDALPAVIVGMDASAVGQSFTLTGTEFGPLFTPVTVELRWSYDATADPLGVDVDEGGGGDPAAFRRRALQPHRRALQSGSPPASSTLTYFAADCQVSVAHTAVTCTAPVGVGDNLDIVVTVAGQPSAPVPGASYAPPTVTAATVGGGDATATLLTGGSELVVVHGTGFGPVGTTGAGVVAMRYGDSFHATSCVTTTAGVAMTCTSVEGVGEGLPVRVAVGGQTAADAPNVTLSYTAPTVSRIHGPGAVSAPSDGDVAILVDGSNFGGAVWGNSLPVSCEYGASAAAGELAAAAACVVVSHSRVQCTSVPGTGPTPFWRVTVVRHPVTYTDAKLGFAAPVVQSFSGAPAADGSPTLGSSAFVIVGLNFGAALGAGDSVTYGPSDTPDLYEAAGCSIIAEHTRIQCDTVPGAGVDLTVRVTIGGQRSTTPTLRFKQPVVTGVTLSSDDGGGAAVALQQDGDQRVVFHGTDFGPDGAALAVDAVTFGPTGVEYVVDVSTCTMPAAHAAVECTTPAATCEACVVVLSVAGNTSPVSVGPSAALSFQAPTVAVVSVLSGTPSTQGGAVMAVRGSGFGLVAHDAAYQLLFGGRALPVASARVLSRNAHELQFVLPEGAGVVDVSVAVRGRGEATPRHSAPVPFAYPPPVVSEVVVVGTGAGTVEVRVKGRDFSDAPVVTLDGAVTQFTSATHTLVVLHVLASSGTVVVTAGGVPSAPVSYADVSPVISAVLSSAGATDAFDTRGGDVLTVMAGSLTLDAASVRVEVGGAPCAVQSVEPDAVDAAISVVACTMPPGQGRNLPVRIFRGLAVSGEDLGAVVSYARPSLTALNVSAVPTDGAPVLVTGANFGVVPPSVQLGTAVLPVRRNSHTELVVDVPAGTGSGAGAVLLVQQAGQVSAEVLTVGYEAPAVVSMPASGPAMGAPIVVEGRNFGPGPDVPLDTPSTGGVIDPSETGAGDSGGGAAVTDPLAQGLPTPNITIGGVPCAVTFWSHTFVNCTVAPGEGIGHVVHVTVDGLPMSTSPAPVWSYDPPSVTSVAPSTVATTGGEVVSVTGTSWLHPQVVLVDVSASTGQALDPSIGRTVYVDPVNGSVTATTLQFVTPPASGFPRQVVVTAGGQFSVRTPATLLALRPPTLAAVTSMHHPTAGGAVVDVVGDSLGDSADALTATIDGTPADVAAGPDHTGVQLTLPAGMGSDLALVVRVGGKPSNALNFSYNPPRVTSVTPNPLDATGGSIVVLGTDFGESPSAVAATLGGQLCTNARWVRDGRYDGDAYVTCTSATTAVGFKNLTLAVAQQRVAYAGVGDVGFVAGAGSSLTLAAECRPGWYGVQGELCVPCPQGCVCPGSGAEPLSDAGFFLLPALQPDAVCGTLRDHRRACPRCLACEPPDACLGNDTCAAAYTGSRCGACEDGYFRLDGEFGRVKGAGGGGIEHEAD